MSDPVTYEHNHPGESLDHLRAAVAHLTRALGLAMSEGVSKEARHAAREARDKAQDAIEAMTRQAEGVCEECLAYRSHRPSCSQNSGTGVGSMRLRYPLRGEPW